MMRSEGACGAHHQIAVVEPRERRRFRPVHRKGQRVGRRRADRVADIGKGDKAVEQVIAVAASAGDVQVEVDFGRRERGDRTAGNGAAQPPRSAGFCGAGVAGAEAGTGARPWSSFASIGGISSFSGPNCSARCH
jgi:hypothetical protein